MNDKLINQFISFIKDERGFSNHTVRSYNFDLVEFSEFFNTYDDKLTFADIDRSAIQFFIQKLSK